MFKWFTDLFKPKSYVADETFVRFYFDEDTSNIQSEPLGSDKEEPSPTIVHKEVVISERERSKDTKYKLDILDALVKVVHDEDVDVVLLAIINTMHEAGYKFQVDPVTTLERIRSESVKI